MEIKLNKRNVFKHQTGITSVFRNIISSPQQHNNYVNEGNNIFILNIINYLSLIILWCVTHVNY